MENKAQGPSEQTARFISRKNWENEQTWSETIILKNQPTASKLVLTFQVSALKRTLEFVQSLVFNCASRIPNSSLEEETLGAWSLPSNSMGEACFIYWASDKLSFEETVSKKD